VSLLANYPARRSPKKTAAAMQPFGNDLRRSRVPGRSSYFAQGPCFGRGFDDRLLLPKAEKPEDIPPALHESAVREECHQESVRENILRIIRRNIT
jgi:hypothetical protein